MENYILLKDLPDAKAGVIFQKFNDEMQFTYESISSKGSFLKTVPCNYVTLNPDWFIKESEYIKMKSYILQSVKDKVIYGYKEKKEKNDTILWLESKHFRCLKANMSNH